MGGLFHEHPRIKAVVSVGCCYHLMNVDEFPKSQIFQELQFKVDKLALKLACHTFHKFDNLRIIGLWRAQTVRAILQVKGKLVLNNEDDLPSCLRKVAFKFNLEEKMVSEHELDICLKKLAFLSTLRSLLGPLIEACVLLDRMCSLQDLGYAANLIPLFNPKLSPRNHALIAIKSPTVVNCVNYDSI